MSWTLCANCEDSRMWQASFVCSFAVYLQLTEAYTEKCLRVKETLLAAFVVDPYVVMSSLSAGSCATESPVGIVLLSADPRDVYRRHGTPLVVVEEYIADNIEPDNIRAFLRKLTRRPHMGGTEAEEQLARWVADTWRTQGLDEVHLVPYHVLLSYPHPVEPNLVRILNDDGSEVWVSEAKQKPLYAPEEASTEVPFTFNGYAAKGDVTGEVVYAYYGRRQDFDFLATEGVDVSGKIILARYGRIFRANTVLTAEVRGALGVVFFSDPADFAPDGSGFVYPNSSFMPSSAAPFGTVLMNEGDPLTPFYPATESAFHISEEEARLPKIPSQPISYEGAKQILSHMGGDVAPASWQGGLNVMYRLGPGFVQQGWMLNLKVNNWKNQTTTYNVVGVLKGREEPDRYVVLGNHLDAWIFGAVDPSSGTAAMLELSRVLLKLHNETGWRPRRSMVFCGWGAEEYGMVGSVEWTEQFGKQLSDRTVAYLNVDMAIEGNNTLRTKSTPLLADVIFESAKKVPNPDDDEVAAGREKVYDTWVLRRPDPLNPDKPQLQFIGSGSDYKGFQHNLGIPCMDTRYTFDNTTLGEPLYHTLYETFALVDEIYDSGFRFHKAVAVLWGNIGVNLADSEVLPFSLVTYSDFITRSQEAILEKYGELLASQNVSLEFFTSAAQKFNESVISFNEALLDINMKSPLAVRHINDQLMMVERAFVDPRGLPGRPHYNHVISAPSETDSYSGIAFSGLMDTLSAIKDAPEGDHQELWKIFAHHLAAVTHSLNTAAKSK
ncbi:N-acetylated-alpha-linked acidic dipeptidase 2-like isoform X3 [Panulirus ornatus]|uniref:N-acetylated-alpha-linked acidic dipeptidase 2-like isoform X3 n=1 Tax=Panulirus ornatus TaxID=150431 RepID=UPI003A8C033C